MAKRFTDTDKWKKPFIKGLPIEYKCFWFFLLDDCDHAGIWHVDIEIASLRLGIQLSLQKARGFFAEKVVEFDNGTKWFLPDFIEFQYGSLSEKNKMFKPVTQLLSKYNLMGHLSSIYGGKEKEQVQVQVMEQVQEDVSGKVFYDAKALILANQIEFESICMESGKSVTTVINSLENYHLWMQEKENYPKSKQALFSGFRRWIKNDRTEPAKSKKRGQFSDSKW